MALQAAPRTSLFAHVRHLAGGSFRRTAAVMALASLALLLPSDHAAALGPHAVYELGEKACWQVLDGGFDSLLVDAGYRAHVEKEGLNPDYFCNCVATEFDLREPLQSFRMSMAEGEAQTAEVFAEILTENIEACINIENIASRGLGDPNDVSVDAQSCEHGCQDGPVWEDESDQLHCEFAIDGTLTPPFFEPEDTLEWIDRSGVGAASLCGCVAATMEDSKDEYAVEFEVSGGDPDVYWLYMNEAISECRRAIWNG